MNHPTPADRATRRLDCDNPAEIEAFERAFYAGFEKATHNRIVHWLWDWNHESRRLRTRIPYSDQQIWTLQEPRPCSGGVSPPSPSGFMVGQPVTRDEVASHEPCTSLGLRPPRPAPRGEGRGEGCPSEFMAREQVIFEQGASHEPHPCGGGVSPPSPSGFMVGQQVTRDEVASHEPCTSLGLRPPRPAPRGEGRGEGCPSEFMAREQVIFEQGASHEPRPCGGGVSPPSPSGFMVGQPVTCDNASLQNPQGPVWAAIAVNVAMRQLQSAAFGFTVPETLREAASAHRVCEFLTLFAVGDPSLSRKLPLWREVFQDLHAAGFTHALATTAPKMLPLYQWIKAEVIGEARIEGESRVFLQFHLGRRRRHP